MVKIIGVFVFASAIFVGGCGYSKYYVKVVVFGLWEKNVYDIVKLYLVWWFYRII